MSTDVLDNSLTGPINPPEPQALSQSPVKPFEQKAPPNRRGVPKEAIPVHLAKENCSKCYGRGYTGRFHVGAASFVLPCRCVLKATTKLIEKSAAEAAKKEKK